MVPPKYKPWLIGLQVFLIAGSAYLLYARFQTEEENIRLVELIAKLQWWQYLLVGALSMVFWLLDTAVWRLVMKPFVILGFRPALKYNLIAQSAGVLTPFLVGDYGLRSFFLRDKLDAKQNTLVTLSYQLIKVGTRIIIGLIAISILSFSTGWRWMMILVGVALLVAGVASVKQLINLLSKTKLANKFFDDKERIDFSLLRLQKTLVPAVFLFMAFSIQTSLLIGWLAPQVDFIDVLFWVIITYSITSFLPPMSFFDPMVKSAVSSLLYAEIASPEILLFGFTLTWVINRGLPALISGLFFKRLSGVRYSTANSTTKPS